MGQGGWGGQAMRVTGARSLRYVGVTYPAIATPHTTTLFAPVVCTACATTSPNVEGEAAQTYKCEPRLSRGVGNCVAKCLRDGG